MCMRGMSVCVCMCVCDKDWIRETERNKLVYKNFKINEENLILKMISN